MTTTGVCGLQRMRCSKVAGETRDGYQRRYEMRAGGVTVWTEFGDLDAEMADVVAAERAS